MEGKMKKILFKTVNGGISIFNLETDEKTEEYYRELVSAGVARGQRLTIVELLEVQESHDFVVE